MMNSNWFSRITWFPWKRRTGKNKGRIKRFIWTAFKEILYITVGILIAFNLNQWNDNKQRKDNYRNYIRGIKRDMQYDTLMFNNYITAMEKSTDSINRVLNSDFSDSLSTYRIENLLTGYFQPVHIFDETYNQLKHSNIYKSSKNENLLLWISGYYRYTNANVERANDAAKELYDQSLLYWSVQQNKYELTLRGVQTAQPQEERKEIMTSLLREPRGRNLAKMTAVRYLSLIASYKNAKEMATGGIKHMDSITNSWNNKRK